GGDTQLGALAAVTGPERVETQDVIGTQQRDVDPEALYAALRVRHGLGERGYVGLFATAVSRFEIGHESYPIDAGQSLCPDGNAVAIGQRCTHDAYVAGIDSRWRSATGAYEVDSD